MDKCSLIQEITSILHNVENEDEQFLKTLNDISNTLHRSVGDLKNRNAGLIKCNWRDHIDGSNIEEWQCPECKAYYCSCVQVWCHCKVNVR